MADYHEYWANVYRAARALRAGVARYGAVLEGDLSDTPPLDPHFAIDRNSDAVAELGAQFEDLRAHASDQGAAMLAAARQLFDEASLSQGPRPLETVIFGSFLILHAPDDAKPDLSAFMRALRPCLRDRRPGRRDRYFTGLATLCDAAVFGSGKLARTATQAIAAEWDHLGAIGEVPPAGLARAICANRPQDWPQLLESVVRGIWPDDALALATGLTPVFASAVQNLSRDVPSEIIAATLHRLLPFLDANPARATLVLDCLFGDGETGDASVGRAPFELRPPDSEDLLPLEAWSVGARSMRPKRGVAPRSFSLSAGDLDDFARGILARHLLEVIVAVEVAQSLAEVA